MSDIKKLETAIRWELQKLREDRKRLYRELKKFFLYVLLTFPACYFSLTDAFSIWAASLAIWQAWSIGLGFVLYSYILSKILLNGIKTL